MGRGDVEVEFRDRRGQLIQQARPVEAGHLDHGVAVRPLVVDGDFRLDHEGARLASGGAPRHHFGQPQLAFQHVLDHFADPGRAPSLVLVAVVFPRYRDGVERAAVGGGVDLGVDDIGARRSAGAGDDRQQPGMIAGENGQLGDAARLVEADIDRELVFGLFAGLQEAGMADLARQFDLEPVGRIVPADIGVEFGFRPFGEGGAEFRLRHSDALRPVHFREAAGQHRFGFVIQRAQQLRLPAVPDPGPDAADVGGGQDGQELHLLDRLHHGGEILDGLAVGEVARLRHRRHRQMLLDQPGDQFGIGGAEAEPRAQPPRHLGAGDRVILGAALGDVVQQRGDVDHRAVLGLDLAHQVAGDGELVIAAALDILQVADAAQQVLVDRVVMIHVELHHRHDLAEGANEMAEHAGLVHAPQHDFRVVRRQDLHEQPVGLGVFAKLRVDQLQRPRHRAHRVRVKGEIVLLCQPKNPDQVDRILLEHVGCGEIDTVVVDDEIVAVGYPAAVVGRPQPRHHPAQHRRRLGLLVFQLGAQDRGEVADVLGDQEIVLHEAFDILHAGMRGITEPDRDLALHVERQPLLGAAGKEMDVAANRPQEIGAAAEGAVFLRVEHAVFQQFIGLAHAVDVFGDPEQRMQVAQATLAVLDVGLDQIARLPGAAVPLLALGELGGDEFRRGALHHFLVEALDQFVVERLVAGQEPGLEDCRADRHVAARLPDRFIDRTGGVADLQPHVPQAIEDRLGHLLAPGGLLVGQDEQQIDVGFRRHQPAAIAAGGDHRHALGAGGHRRAVEMAGGGGIQDADDLVLHEAQPLCAAPPVPVLQQHRLRHRAGLDHFRFQQLRHGGAKNILAAGMGGGERVHRR